MSSCLENCKIMGNLCVQECRGLVPNFGLHNAYYECATDPQVANCNLDLGQIPEKDCVEKNKENHI